MTFRSLVPTSASWALSLAALAVATLAGVGQTQPASPRRLIPMDQAASRPDFFTFRAQLQTALARRDVAALLAVVHPNIKNGFGGDDGKANFEVKWRPAAADSEVWATLAEVLALGGTFESPDTFVRAVRVQPMARGRRWLRLRRRRRRPCAYPPPSEPRRP